MTLEIFVEVAAEKIRDSIKVKLGDLDITLELDEDQLEEIKNHLDEEEFESRYDAIDPEDCGEGVG